MQNLLKTSDLMKAAGVGRNTLRFYEHAGLLKEAQRTPAGYRLYSRDVLLDLKFIQQAKSSGFSLGEIKHLLSISHGTTTCGIVSQRIEAKIKEVDRVIAELKLRKEFLKQFLGICSSMKPDTTCDIRAKGLRPGACCG